jgi:hypothetical protein
MYAQKSPVAAIHAATAIKTVTASIGVRAAPMEAATTAARLDPNMAVCITRAESDARALLLPANTGEGVLQNGR